MMQPDDPPFLTVGTEVSAKYKGAFCEAKVNKVVKNVKVKVSFKLGMGSAVVSDDNIKGVLKVSADVKAFHPDKNQHIDGIISKIQDCSQYTVVFDDGDITTLRRSSLCLKSGRHFAESETLDQLPLTHPEHFGTPVVGGRRGRRSRHHADSDEGSSEEEDVNVYKKHRLKREEWASDMGKVVCIEIGDKKKQKDNWFPGLVVAPTAQDSVKIETKKDYLIRSFQDGRYYTVPKKEATIFNREIGTKVSQSSLRAAVDKALLYIDRDELPPHWDRDLLFGINVSDFDLERDSDSDSSDDEPREEKDHFVAQLYKFMEECGTPINKGPTLANKDLDLYKLFKVVQNLGGFNRVMNQNQWKVVSVKMGLNTLGSQSSNLVKAAYKKYLQSFEDFYRKLGCTMVSNPRGSRTRHRSGRSLIRDCDKNPRPAKRKGTESCESAEDTEEELKKEEIKMEDSKRPDTPTRKETRKKESDDTKENERKKDDGRYHRNRTPPVRTNSPTTRERSKESKPLRQDTKSRLIKKDDEHKTRSVKDEEHKTRSVKDEDYKTRSIREEEHKNRSCRDEDPKPRSIKDEEHKNRSTAKEEEPRTRSAVKEEKKYETESEEEIEVAKTRSLRNREDREKEPDLLVKKAEKKIKQEHQRSTSCNSTSSSSSCTSSSTSNLVDGKNSRPGKLKLLKQQNSLEDLKKKGRKRKTDDELEIAGGKQLLPLHIPINIGDKLRVLYGPNNKESKVTYEAKVLEIDEERDKKMYYVHYLGWNTRYDEWVMRQRIAQNLSSGQARNKKSKIPITPKEGKKKEEKDDKRENLKDIGTRSGTPSTRRGRPIVPGQKKDNDRSDSNSSSKATTRSGAAQDVIQDRRRRSKRKAVSSWIRGTEESDSDDFESGNETSSDRGRVRQMSEGHLPSSVSTSPGNLTPDPSHDGRRDESSKGSLHPLSRDGSSCGKDIDLKAIESEMKGLDRPVKKEDGVSAKEIGGRILTTVIPGSLTITEKKKHDPKKPHDSPVKRVEIPVRLVPAQEVMGQIKPLPLSGMKKEPLLEEDIYEFKEPEPFEMCEIRSRKDSKSRNSGSQEDLEPEVKGKRKGRPKKENEEKSGSDSDVSLSPQKRISLSRESKDSPKKSDHKDTPTKKDGKEVSKKLDLKKDYSRRVESKDEIKVVTKQRSVSPPCLQIRETDFNIDSADKNLLIDLFQEGGVPGSGVLPVELKDLKLETIGGKEMRMIGSSVVVTPKKLSAKKEGSSESKVDNVIPIKSKELETLSKTGDKAEDAKLLKDSKVGTMHDINRSKPIAVMTRIPGQSGHVLAQVVMPTVESRILTKGKSGMETKIIEKTGYAIPPEISISAAAKYEDRGDGKMVPFSLRQQQIFPHLLKRSDHPDDKELIIPRPYISPPTIAVGSPPSIPVLPEASGSCIQKPSTSQEGEKPKCESTVEESIEAVVLRARQDPMQVKEEKKPEEKSFDKRRRNAGRSKKALREFVADSSEDSDSDSKATKGDHLRQKRHKVGEILNKYSPGKRTVRSSTGEDKKLVRKCDEEERANDADEEDNESNFPPLKILSKEADKRRKEMEAEKDVETKEAARLLKNRRRSSAAKRLDDCEETGIGDLLCEETIPPGSPMPQDNLIIDTESTNLPSSVKQEMPFASVPTGSSFSKRDPISSQSASQISTGHLQASLRQLHSSVCIQSVPPSHPSVSSSSASIQPNITITSINSSTTHIAPLPKNKSSFHQTEKSGKSAPVPVSQSLHNTNRNVTNKVSGSESYSKSQIMCVDPSKVSTSNNSSASSVLIIPSVEMNTHRPDDQQKVVNRSMTSIDNTPPTTPESIISNLSDSPRRENEVCKNEDNSTKSGQYSSELEYDKTDHYSEDSNTMDSSSKEHTTKRTATITNTIACTQSWGDGDDVSLVPSKKRKRTTKFHTPSDGDTSYSKSGGQHGSNQSNLSYGGTKRKRLHLFSKGKEEECDTQGLTTLSLAACKAGGARSRYNFCQELDPDLDATKRIAVLQSRMQELKRTYMQVKSELASVERRRKKLKKREKEKEAAATSHVETA